MFELLLLINSQRVVPVAEDPALTIWAEMRANIMCGHPEWGHLSLESFIPPETDWVKENLAHNYPTYEAAHNALVASPSHFAAMTDSSVTKVGLGRADCGASSVVVELFSY